MDPDGVEVIAVLPTLWVSPSGHAVTPVVAWWRTPSEVAPGDSVETAAVAYQSLRLRYGRGARDVSR